jgi:hypothetical protein
MSNNCWSVRPQTASSKPHFFDDHMSTHDRTRANMCINEKPRYFQNAGLEAIDGRRPKPKRNTALTAAEAKGFVSATTVP